MRSFAPILAALPLLFGSCGAAVEEGSQAEPADGGWPFAYPANKPRRPGAKDLLDLRSLNEAVAGQSGFVRRSDDGNDFVLGDGTPARFWAVGSDVFRQSPEAIARHARFLAKMGVNLARLHAQVAPKGPGSKLTDVDEKEIDGIWRFVAEARKQGIYTTISPYWATGKDAAGWGLEGYGQGDLWGLLFFDETLQKGYKAWARALYARPNPHTGTPLAKDPAVALIQVQNEDSLLFWTTQTLKPAAKARFAARFAGWLAKKYGSVADARKAWGVPDQPGDDPAQGRVGLLGIYPMTIRQSGGMARRVADEVAFHAETQRAFYASMARYYRDDLGCGQLINASNWRTADQARMDDAERWTYAATDVIAANHYYNGGAHVGPQSGWRVDPGDRFSQKSALVDPRGLPFNLKQVAGHPMILTESSWVTPLAFQSEGPFLVAVYQSLTGVDAFYWFSANHPEYDEDPFFPYQKVKGQAPLLKFSCAIPPILGSFPAAAVLFRKGYVRQGTPVVHEERTLQSLWDRDPPMIAEDPAFDPNRDRGQGPAAAAAGPAATAVDPLAFLAGPVEVVYGGDPAKTRVSADLPRLIDRDKKRVRSVTGEVTLDYGKGTCTVDAPKAQGACGFLAKAGPIQLRDLSIRSSNPYASVLVVPLDDRPLASSLRVLVQVATAARPTGWQTRDAEFPGEDGKALVKGLEVVRTGRPPWRVANTEVGLALKNPGLAKATLLDPAGYPAGKIPVTRAKTGVTLVLPPETMYLLLEP